MLLFLFLSALSLGAASAQDGPTLELQRGACPPSWFGFQDRCYKYVDTDMTWAEAEFHCVSRGANLVSIHSQEEQEFVNLLIRIFDQTQGVTWMGFHDLYKEGRWVWSDGTPATFLFWQLGEPNNYDGQEHCAVINWGSPPKWNDGTCPSRFPSVCATPLSNLVSINSMEEQEFIVPLIKNFDTLTGANLVWI